MRNLTETIQLLKQQSPLLGMSVHQHRELINKKIPFLEDLLNRAGKKEKQDASIALSRARRISGVVNDQMLLADCLTSLVPIFPLETFQAETSPYIPNKEAKDQPLEIGKIHSFKKIDNGSFYRISMKTAGLHHSIDKELSKRLNNLINHFELKPSSLRTFSILTKKQPSEIDPRKADSPSVAKALGVFPG